MARDGKPNALELSAAVTLGVILGLVLIVLLPVILPVAWLVSKLRRARTLPAPYAYEEYRRDMEASLPVDDILEKCRGRFPERRDS